MEMKMNSVSLVGRLTKEPELQVTKTGKSLVKFILAVDGYEDHTDFISCIAWNKTGELLSQYCTKGSLISIVGRIETGSYEKDGAKVYTTTVVVSNLRFLDNKKKEQNKETDVDEEDENLTMDINDYDMPF